MFDITARLLEPGRTSRSGSSPRAATSSATIDSALAGTRPASRTTVTTRSPASTSPTATRARTASSAPRCRSRSKGRRVARVLDAAARRQRHLRARPLRRRPHGRLRRQRRLGHRGWGSSEGPSRGSLATLAAISATGGVSNSDTVGIHWKRSRSISSSPRRRRRAVGSADPGCGADTIHRADVGSAKSAFHDAISASRRAVRPWRSESGALRSTGRKYMRRSGEDANGHDRACEHRRGRGDEDLRRFRDA